MRKDIKKEPRGLLVIFTMLANMVFLVAIGTGVVLSIKYSQETNRLLSTFQRIDTVKDETPLFFTTTGDFHAETTPYSYDDPNICSHIKTICHGESCDQNCRIGNE